MAGFNNASTPTSRGEHYISTYKPQLTMTHAKIALSFNQVTRIGDIADLVELLFPGNRNQQHAGLAVWLALKWADNGLVPNLADVAERHGVSRRTLERVRAKLRALGLIDHVSRFNARHGGREGWILSGRFEASLRRMADQVYAFRCDQRGAREKDMLLLEFADARRATAGRRPQRPAEQEVIHHDA